MYCILQNEYRYVELHDQKHEWRYFFQVCRKKYFHFFSFSGGLSCIQIGPGIQNLKKKSSENVKKSNMSQLHILGLGVGWGEL